MPTINQSDIVSGNSLTTALDIFQKIIGAKGTKAQNQVVLSNAAFAIMVIDSKQDFTNAYHLAEDSLLGLKAQQCLEKMLEYNGY